MQRLAAIIPGSKDYPSGKPINPEQRETDYADWFNSESGNLDSLAGYDCPKCKNRGRFAKVIERAGSPECVFVDCECMEIRKSIAQMKQSGLADLAKRCSFDNFETEQEWQRKIVQTCRAFANGGNGWLFIGGQPGSGKTHLGVAVTTKIMHDFKRDARYYVWPDAIRATWGDFEAYKAFVNNAKNATVLYLDDLFKPAQGKTPSANEIECAFEILNSRYNAAGKTTVITCEYTISELCGIDEALGSRIVEGCRKTNSCVSIGKQPGRNYRLRGVAEI